MNSRRSALLALAAAAALALSGCTFITPQATTIQYSASDGVNIADSGPLMIRNVLIVTNEEGEDGNLIAAIVNETSDDQTLNVQFEGGAVQEIEVPADSVVSLGAGEDPLLLEGIDTGAGQTLDLAFQAGDGDTTVTAVPVLDGELEEYSDLVPEAAEAK